GNARRTIPGRNLEGDGEDQVEDRRLRRQEPGPGHRDRVGKGDRVGGGRRREGEELAGPGVGSLRRSRGAEGDVRADAEGRDVLAFVQVLGQLGPGPLRRLPHPGRPELRDEVSWSRTPARG